MSTRVTRNIVRIGTAGAAATIATALGIGAALKGVIGDNDPCDFDFNFEADPLTEVA